MTKGRAALEFGEALQEAERSSGERSGGLVRNEPVAEGASGNSGRWRLLRRTECIRNGLMASGSTR